MTGVGAAFEGKLPSRDEIVANGLFMTGFHAATAAHTNSGIVGDKLGEIYANTGDRPETTVQKANEDVILKQQILSEDPHSPETAKPTDFKQEVVNTGTEEAPKPEIRSELVPREEPKKARTRKSSFALGVAVPKAELEAAVGEVPQIKQDQASILSHIGEHGEKPSPTFKESALDFYQKHVDKFDPLDTPESKEAYMKARIFAGAIHDKVLSMFQDGTRDFKTGEKNGEGLFQILKDMAAEGQGSLNAASIRHGQTGS